MPWCPKCKAEYERYVKTCADCGVELTDEQPPEEPIESDKPVLLTNAADFFEANIIAALLESADIPVMKGANGFGGDAMRFLVGENVGVVSIFVPSGALQKAREILASRPEPTEEDLNAAYNEDPKDSNLSGEYYSKHGRALNKSIWFFVILGIVLIILFVVSTSYHWWS